MRHVVVDANALISFFVERHEKQNAQATDLLQRAEDGELIVVLPQFIIFEISYVLQSVYGFAGTKAATLVRDIIEFPDLRVIDHCPWALVFKYWPDALPSVADAALVAVAASNNYDAIATFDQKLINRMKTVGVSSYW